MCYATLTLHIIQRFPRICNGCVARLASVLPASSHTAFITQVELLLGFIEPFLKGETPRSFFQDSRAR